MNSSFATKFGRVGDGEKTYIIAEMSANHAGSLTRALEIIHAAKEAGADCLKIQTYTPDTITLNCDNSFFRIDDGTWKGENLYSLYGKAFTPWEWQGRLKEEADKVGLDFLSTPFDATSVDFLESIGVDFYKIASFELVDIPLIKYVAGKGKPIIMSTGMGSLAEIEEAVETIRKEGNENLALLKCSSAYPANPAEMNLSAIPELKEKFGTIVGLSDHSLGHLSSVMSVTLGGRIIEKHFCLSRNIDNPDVSFSMTPSEFAAMVKEVRNAEAALGTAHFGPMEMEMSNYRFRKSIFVAKDIAKGEVFTPENVRVVRPSDGLHPRYYEAVLGKKATRDLKFGSPLAQSDVENL